MQSGRRRVDDLSGARGFGDRLGNAQILQAVPGADDRFDFPSIATVSSTGKPRVARDEKACTATISPHSMRRLCTSWIMLSRIGPPPAPGAMAHQRSTHRLEEDRAAHHGDQRSEPTFVDQLLRAPHDRAGCPMVTDQDLCAYLVG